MKQELQQALFNDFPDEFQQKKHSMQETCMCWGCECGDGWEPLLRRMCEKIKGFGVEFTQIKEKYGTLRAYYIIKTDAKFTNADYQMVENAIDQAEKESETTCEDCGKEGELRDGGWMRTLCDACEENRFKK